jgi:hypothetical protein
VLSNAQMARIEMSSVVCPASSKFVQNEREERIVMDNFTIFIFGKYAQMDVEYYLTVVKRE